MSASSPALSLVQVRRPLAVPRPRPRGKPVPRLGANDTGPRATLRSVDLELVYDSERAAPRSTIPPPLPARARSDRAPIATPPTSRPELGDEVVATLGLLADCESAAEAASYCLVAAMQAIPSLAGVVVLRDDERGGYVVVYARGRQAHEAVRRRVDEMDPAIGQALVHGSPVAVEYGEERPPLERHAVFGDPWTVFVAPAQDQERCLGSVELVDPIGGPALGESARHALVTIARHLGDSAHGRRLAPSNVYAPEHLGLGA
jgi:GAF domain-containing protein